VTAKRRSANLIAGARKAYSMLHQHTACLIAWTNARAVANLLLPVGFLGRHDEYRNGGLQDPIDVRLDIARQGHGGADK
jgi:hypothetical protein